MVVCVVFVVLSWWFGLGASLLLVGFVVFVCL